MGYRSRESKSWNKLITGEICYAPRTRRAHDAHDARNQLRAGVFVGDASAG